MQVKADSNYLLRLYFKFNFKVGEEKSVLLAPGKWIIFQTNLMKWLQHVKSKILDLIQDESYMRLVYQGVETHEQKSLLYGTGQTLGL